MSRKFNYVEEKPVKKSLSVKNLVSPFFSVSGRNRGRLAIFHKGGRVKIKLKNVDLQQTIKNVPGIVREILYDPARSALVHLVCYQTGHLAYKLGVRNLKVGDFVYNHSERFLANKVGMGFKLKFLKPGTKVCQISYLTSKAIFTLAAGTSSQLLKHWSERYSLVKLPSGEHRLIPSLSDAITGSVGNWGHRDIIYGSAGVKRRLGYRPIVRGLAMNPIDHPHGGGDTKGKHPCSPWGQLSKGFRTVRVRSSFIVKPRFIKKLFFLYKNAVALERFLFSSFVISRKKIYFL